MIHMCVLKVKMDKNVGRNSFLDVYFDMFF